MCSKLVKESYKKAFQRNALHGTYELGRLAAELKVILFWRFDLLILEQLIYIYYLFIHKVIAGSKFHDRSYVNK